MNNDPPADRPPSNRKERRSLRAQSRRPPKPHKIPAGGKFVYRDGLPLLVIRPNEPGLALGHARMAELLNDQQGFQDVLQKPSSYTFRGYLRAQGRQGLPTMYVSDEHGVYLEALQPGDSFVLMRDVEKAHEAAASDQN
jgi:hypothetical protein